MTLHMLEPNQQTVYGYFSRELAPVLTINSGDIVRYRTLDAGWKLEPPRLDREPHRKFLQPTDAPLKGHALCGPVAIHNTACHF